MTHGVKEVDILLLLLLIWMECIYKTPSLFLRLRNLVLDLVRFSINVRVKDDDVVMTKVMKTIPRFYREGY